MTIESNQSTTDPDASIPEHELTVEDAFVFRTTSQRFEEVLSKPDQVAAAIPGVSELAMTDDGTYTCSITQSISGITHLTLSMWGEFEVYRPDGPATAVIRGTAEDPGTGSELDVVAAIRIEAIDGPAVELEYVADISIRTANASLTPELLEPTFTESIRRAADTLGSALSDQAPEGE